MRARIIAFVVATLDEALSVPVKAANGYARYAVSKQPVVVVDVPSEDLADTGKLLALGSSVEVEALLTVGVAYSATKPRAAIEDILEQAHLVLSSHPTLGGDVGCTSYAGFDLSPAEDDGDVAVATNSYTVCYRR